MAAIAAPLREPVSRPIGEAQSNVGPFLGVAGLVMKDGANALWQPLGFAAGYLALLLFVAAPLRRCGAYTVADFAEGRLESEPLRVLCAAVVLIIAGLYLVPQLKGAGLALQEIVGAPYWVGIVVVGLIVAFAVALGGMRAITYVQAFQYFKLGRASAAVVVFFVLIVTLTLAQWLLFRRRLEYTA